ncbi:hypothetical protein ES703_08210 [subsurface metagenome]
MFKTRELLPSALNLSKKSGTLYCLASHLFSNTRLPCGYLKCPYDEKFCRKVYEVICGKTVI